jgi:REP element-mobilizing transposase RayT
MPRIARVVDSGATQHVTQRGNNRQVVFFVDPDRRAYLGMLKKSCADYGVAVHGLCRIRDQVHLGAGVHLIGSHLIPIASLDFATARYTRSTRHVAHSPITQWTRSTPQSLS